MSLEFLKEAANVILIGPNGVGKSTIAANIAHRAVIEGHTVRFATAAKLLGELATIDSDTKLQRKLRFYARQHLLVIDEVGYLSYSNRHADLLFNIVSSRSRQRSTIITTNRRPSGARLSPTPLAWSPWSTASSTTPRSSPSKAIPIAARRPGNARSSATPSAAAGGARQRVGKLARKVRKTPGNRRRSHRRSSSVEPAGAGRDLAKLSPRVVRSLGYRHNPADHDQPRKMIKYPRF